MPLHHRKLPRSDDLSVSDMKGLISWVAQQISTVTRLIHDKHALDYQKQEREKLYPTKPGSRGWHARGRPGGLNNDQGPDLQNILGKILSLA